MPKIAVLTEGKTEKLALPGLLAKLFPDARERPVVLYQKLEPKSTSEQVRQQLHKLVPTIKSKGIARVVLLLDLEDRRECPGKLAASMEDSLNRSFPQLAFTVVFKVRMFENWLLADPDSLPQRFQLSNAKFADVSRGNADRVADPVAMLRKACASGDYHKVSDARQIAESLDPLAMARNSRSFRRLLRCLGHPDYASQSARPAREAT